MREGGKTPQTFLPSKLEMLLFSQLFFESSSYVFFPPFQIFKKKKGKGVKKS